MTRSTPREHGTLAKRRREGCACDRCVDAGRRYERRRSKLRAMGRPAYIPAGPTRAHLDTLRAAGMTSFQIEQASGVHRTAVAAILGIAAGRPASQKIRPRTAHALLAVQPADAHEPNGDATLDGTGTRRRIEALISIGYTRVEIARRLGMDQLQIARKQRVRASTARAVRALYAELENTAGPSRYAIAEGRRRGYLAPAWWDPDTLDDPAADPTADAGEPELDLVAVEQFLDGHRLDLDRPERNEVIRRLHDLGLTDREVAERVGGITPDGVMRVRHRAAS